MPPKNPTLTVFVRNSGFNGWALSFNGYLRRGRSEIGCYLAAQQGYDREVRIFNELAEGLDELHQQLPGLEQWDDPRSGRPRIGFRRRGSLDFLAETEDSEGFREAVAWMREHLNLLVSALNPRLQARLNDER